MRWFNDLTIVWKLVSGFAVMILVAAVVGVAGVTSIRQLDRSATEMYEHNTVPLVYLSRAVDNFQQLRINLFKFPLSTGASDDQAFSARVRELAAITDAAVAEYEQTIVTEEARLAHAELVAAGRDFTPLRDDVVRL